MSISGEYAIVGAYADDDKGSSSGSAYIFKCDGASWTQEYKMTASDGVASDYFGYAVSISGDYAIVGAYQDDDNGSSSGSAYIFKRNGTSWTQEAKLTASDGYVSDDFGTSVSISNDYAIVGAQYNDAVASNSGAAYIFKRSGSTWNQVEKLVADDGGVNNYFGRNVSIKDDYAIVPAYGHDLPIPGCGTAYVFKRVESNWINIKKLTASDAETGDNLGAGVAIDNGYAFVSSRLDDNDNGTDSGTAYFFPIINKARLTSVNYQRVSHETASIPIPLTLVNANGGSISISATSSSLTKISGILFESTESSGYPLTAITSPGIPLNLSLTITPTPGQFGPSTITLIVTDANGLTDVHSFVYDVLPPVQKFVSLDAEASDNFGVSIDISENTIICGARNDDDIGTNSGNAFIFQKGETGWSQYQKLTAFDGAESDYFGYGTAISGNNAIVGAFYDDDRGTNSGSAYIFTKIGKTWVQSAKLLASDGADSDRFGYAVSISGDYAIVGAYLDDYSYTDQGCAYIFYKSDMGWIQQAKLTATDRAASDYFGYAVSISGDYAIVGAYYDDDNGSSSGSAYIFVKNTDTWTQQTKLVPTDGAASDCFGYAVSISDDNAIVSAINHDGSHDGKNAGAAYIYHREDTVWSLAEKLTPMDGSTNDNFGYFVDISTNYAITGAKDDDDSGSSSGSAYVYQRDGESWSLKVKLTPDDGKVSEYFGVRVAITDNYATASTDNGDNENGIATGSFYVYTLNTSPTIVDTENQSLDLTSSSLSFNITIIDADGRDITLTAMSSNPECIPDTHIDIEHSGSNTVVSPTTSGMPLVLNVSINPTNIEITDAVITLLLTDADGLTHTTRFNVSMPLSEEKLIADDGAASDYYGYRLAMSGNYAIVGAYNDGNGSAYILHRNATGWYQSQKIVASDGASGDRFGYRVDMDGDYAIIGAYLDDYSYGNSGSAYIFKRYGNTWIQETRINASDREENAYFGFSVAINGQYAIVGAYYDNHSYTDQGAAYIFKQDGASWVQEAKLLASDAAASDLFGYEVSIFGDYAIVGATYEDYRGSNSGSAYIFKRNGTSWTQEAKITASDGYANDQFGHSVAITNEYAIVGAYYADSNGSDAGAAYVYKRFGSSWEQVAKLISNDTIKNDSFGQSVKISGDYAIIGAYTHSTPFASCGAAYIFKQTGSEWINIKKLTASDAGASDYFGIDVSLDNGYAIVGAYTDDDIDTNSGAVYVYPVIQKARLLDISNHKVTHETASHAIPLTLMNPNGGNFTISANASDLSLITSIQIESSGSVSNPLSSTLLADTPLELSLTIIPTEGFYGRSTITLLVTDANGLTDTKAFVYDVLPPEEKLLANDGENNDDFGYSVDISGNYAIVGAHYDDDTASNCGSAYIYQKTDTGWSQAAKLTAHDGNDSDYFGFNVSISGNYAIVGAYYDDDKGSNSGSAYIYNRIGNQWIQSTKLLASDGLDNDRFGYNVAISGDKAIVGAYLDDHSYTDQGSVYIFKREGSSWVQQAKLTASDRAASDYFGFEVDIFGNYAIIGAYSDDDNGSSSGSAYIFYYNGTNWTQQAKLTASDGEASDNFGYAVEISEDFALVGAYADDDEGSASGSAYIFKRDGTSWSQWQKLTPGDGASDDYFGYNLSISDNYVIVGSKGDDDQGSASGSAYVYEKLGTNWIFKVKLTSTDGQPSESFAWDVAVSETEVIVGTPNGYSNDVSTGSAYIYTFQSRPIITEIIDQSFDLSSDTYAMSFTIADADGQNITINAYSSDQNIVSDNDIDVGNSGNNFIVSSTTEGQLLSFDLSLSPQKTEYGSTTITLMITDADGLTCTSNFTFSLSPPAEEKIIADDGEADDTFGNAVSISGDYAIVSANKDDDNGSNSGSVYILQRHASGWQHSTKLIASDGNTDDNFGCSVDISGNFAIVGANYDDPTYSNTGTAYIFRRAGNLWQQEDLIYASDRAASDYFGYAVSISGEYVIVGAYADDATYTNQGAAYIFIKDGVDWVQQAKLIASDKQASDYFGISVSISGDYAVVGAYAEDTKGSASGAAYVFKRNGTAWSQEAKIYASDGVANDNFGRSVSISGDTILVGAYSHDSNGSNSGAAYVYQRDGSTWTQVAKLTSNDIAAGDYFGLPVSLSGDYAAIGAYNKDEFGSNSGAIYIFKRIISDWVQIQKIVASDAAETDTFGNAVAINNGYVIAGAKNDDDNGSNSGSVYLYPIVRKARLTLIPDLSVNHASASQAIPLTIIDVNGGNITVQAVSSNISIVSNDNILFASGNSNTLTTSTIEGVPLNLSLMITPAQSQYGRTTISVLITDAGGLTDTKSFVYDVILPEYKITANDGASDDNFGYAVSISGNYAICGAVYNDGLASNTGAAYIFTRSETGFSQTAKLTANDGVENDYFGRSVSISGNYAIIGTYGDDDKGDASGSAYIFKKQGSEWLQSAKLTASDGAASDSFGLAVAMSGDYAIVGAYLDDASYTDQGSAYIYKRNNTGWHQEYKIQASDRAASDRFGYAVSIAGDYVIVGAYYDDDNGTSSGSAYIFKRDGSTWSQEAKLKPGDGAASDYFGYAVSISGDYAIIGAYNNDDLGSNSGSAYIFKRNGTAWNETTKLTAYDGFKSDSFGHKVSIKGDYAIVGAYTDDDKGSSSGASYIYKRNEENWNLMVKLTNSDGIITDYFGASVDIDDNYAIISAYNDDDNGSNSGSAYIYELNTAPTLVEIENQTITTETASLSLDLTLINSDGRDITLTALSTNPSILTDTQINFNTSGLNTIVLTASAGTTSYLDLTITFAQMEYSDTTVNIMITDADGITQIHDVVIHTDSPEEKITASDGAASDYFGYATSIHGDYAIVGSKNDDDNGTDSGSAYILKRGADGWQQQAKILPSDGAASDYFGKSVSIYEDYAIVGAYYDDVTYENDGSAYIFRRIGTNWHQEIRIYASDRVADDRFGYAVAIYGDYAIIGAYLDDNGATNQGSAYIFQKDGAAWTQVAKFYASDYNTSDYFGSSVSIYEDYAIIGAYYDDEKGSNAGAAYIFKRDGTSWTQEVKLMASDGLASDMFGYATSIYKNYAIIGAYGHDYNGSSSGTTYIFKRDGSNWTEIKKLLPNDGAVSDVFGYRVDITDQYAFVSAHQNDDYATNTGAAYIFKNMETDWVQIKKLTSSDHMASDYFGMELSLTDEYAIIGAYGDDDDINGTDSGSVYLYPIIQKASLMPIDDQIGTHQASTSLSFDIVNANDGIIDISATSSNFTLITNGNIVISDSGSNNLNTTTMENEALSLSLTLTPNAGIYGKTNISILVTDANGLTDSTSFVYDVRPPEQKIIAKEGAMDDHLGRSVGISGIYAIVGADDDDEAATNSGSAYIFQYGETGWTQAQKLVPVDGEASDYFGIAVDISGNYGIIGAHGDDDKGSLSGAAYIFTRNGDTWIQSAKLTALDGAVSDYFGYYAVSLSGDYAIIGAWQDDYSYSNQGSAYIFKRYGSSWVQEIRLQASDRYTNDYFGRSVSISGDYAIVGAYADDDLGTDSGSAYIFVRDGANWNEQAKLTASDGESSDNFGIAVSISGDYAIVGAQNNDDQGSNSGSAYIFKRNATSWSETVKLTQADGASNDIFGAKVSISGDYAIVSSYNDDDKGNASGSVYIYKRNGSDWPLMVKLTGSDSWPSDNFGFSVAMSNNHAIVSAYLDDDTGSNSGSAYIYELNTQPMLSEMKNLSFTNTTDSQSIHLTIVDCDGSDITITAISSNSSLVSDIDININGSGSNVLVSNTTAGTSTYLSLTITPAQMEVGDATINLIVSNSAGLTSLATFDVSVMPVEQKITATDVEAGDDFGYNVAMSGNYAIIGAPDDDDKGSNSGAVYIYQRSASGWQQMSKITAEDGAATDYFGQMVAMDQDYIIVSAHYDDHNYTNQGSAYIYKRYGNNWHLESKIYASDKAENDYFGRSVSISGEWAIVGASHDDHWQTDQGSAYIFRRDGAAWTQFTKLYASDYAASDYFGYAASISENYAIVGSYYDDDKGSASGSAYIYYFDGSSWSQQAKLTASDGEASDLFGISVFISGDYAIIGAQNNDTNGANSGAAYIFERDGTSWYQITKLTGNDELASDTFGCSVYLKDGYAIVGAKNDDDSVTNSGSAYIFKQIGSEWVQLKKLNASDADVNDYFGQSVAIDNGYALVGSKGDDDNGTDSGSAYFYPIMTKARLSSMNDIMVSNLTSSNPIPITLIDTNGGNFTISATSSNLSLVAGENINISGSVSNIFNGNTLADESLSLSLNITPTPGIYGKTTILLMVTDANGMTDTQSFVYDFVFPEQKIIASDGATDDSFGCSVDIFSDIAIIGADDDDEFGTNSGSAYIYQYSGTNWVQTVKLLPSDGAASDYFGNQVSISENFAIVGSSYDDDMGTNSGSAYMFERNGNSWTQSDKLTANDGLGSDYFGCAVSIDGNYAVVGAKYDDSSYTNQGSAYIFKYDGTNWVQESKIIASDPAASDYFGFAVSISGDYVLIGAYLDDDNATDSGSAYIFKRSGASWNQETKLTASDGAASDYFGYAVSISGAYAIIGAYNDDDEANQSGSSYIFKRDGTTWSETQKLTPGDGASSDTFGYKVAISGNNAIVASKNDDDKGKESGSAYVYKYSGESWNLVVKLTGSDSWPNDQYGISVGISGNNAIIGAYYDNIYGEKRGSAYIYQMNSTPVISGIFDDSTSEDTAYIKTFQIHDQESLPCSLSITWTTSDSLLIPSENILLECNNDTYTITAMPVLNQSGAASITIIASDAEGLSTVSSFALQITPVNDAPEISSISDQITLEDTAIENISFTITDIETDASSLTLTGYSSQLTLVAISNIVFNLTGINRTVSITPTDQQYGQLTITIAVTDGELTSTTSFELTITSVDDSPEISSLIPDQTATEDIPYSFIFVENTFMDNDSQYGDSLTYSATLANNSSLPDWLAFTPVNRHFAGTPENSDVGLLTITVTATDNTLLSTSDTFYLTVINVNDAPTLENPIINQVAMQDSSYTMTFDINTFIDIDPGDILSYSAVFSDGAPLSGWLSFDSNTRTFSGTPAGSDLGTLTIVVTATDSQAEAITDTFTINAFPTNYSPTLTNPMPDQTLLEDNLFTFTFLENTFDDANSAQGDTLFYSAIQSSGMSLPNWLSFTGSTRTFSGIPLNADVGMLTITVSASDMFDETAYDSFVLTIVNINDAPIVANAIPDQTATEEVLFNFTFDINTFTDEDNIFGDSLSYSAVLSNGAALPDWLTFTQASRTFSGTPADADCMQLTIMVSASDTAGLTATTTFGITVVNVNDPPTISFIADQTILEDASSTSIPFTIADIDNDVSTLVVSSISSDISLISADNISLSGTGAAWSISFTPTANEYGQLSITIAVSDNQLTTTTSFAVDITPVNDLPVMSGIADQTTSENMAINTISFTLTDQETASCSLLLTILSSNETVIPNSNITSLCNGDRLTLSINPATDQTGTVILTLIADDTNGLTVSTSFTIEVYDRLLYGLLAHYEFNANFEDSSASANHGACTGTTCPEFTYGLYGPASNFDGTLDYIDTGIDRGQYSEMSVCAWIKYSGTDADGFKAIFAGESGDFFVGKRSGDTFIGIQDGEYNASVTSSTTAWDGNWHLICYTYDGTTGIVYLDNNQVGSASFAGGSGKIYIGHEIENDGYYFPGKLDEARLYDRVLSLSEVQELYNLTHGLVAYYSFDGNSNDESGYTNNATLYGGYTYTTGIAGQTAFNADNYSPTRIIVADSPSLDTDDIFTLSAWIKPDSYNATSSILIMKGYSTPYHHDYIFWLTHLGQLELAIYNVENGFDGDALLSDQTITLNRWSHIATTFDSGEMKIYVNGQLADEKISSFTHTDYTEYTYDDLGIGAHHLINQDFRFFGSIDELRIYNRKLAGDEIYQLATIAQPQIIFSDISNQTISEDTSLSVSFTATEADYAACGLTLSFETSDPGIIDSNNMTYNCQAQTYTISILPETNQSGTAMITITAQDIRQFTQTTTVAITVTPVNDAPEISQIVDQSMQEDTSSNPIKLTLTDVDSNAENISLTVLSSNTGILANTSIQISGTAANRSLVLTPTANEFGVITITVLATDGSLTTTITFELTINDVNDAPEISDISDQGIYEDMVSTAIAFNITDLETNAADLTLSAMVSDTTIVNSENIIFSGTGQSRNLTVTPTTNEYGQVTITIAVSDNSLTSISSFILSITPVNDAPVISHIPDHVMDEDSLSIIDIVITDIESASCDLSVTVKSSNTSLVSASNFSYTCAANTFYYSITPINNQSGNSFITITAMDSEGLTASKSYTLTVNNINDAPFVANEIPDQIADEDVSYSFTFNANTFDDMDIGDSLTYTATLENNTPLPNWLIFNESTRTFSGTPLNDDIGVITIKVTSTDQSLASISDSFALTVNNTNDAPTLANAIQDQNFDEDSPYSFTIDENTFNDVDTTDTLTYTATLSNDAVLPSWLDFDASSRTFSGTPLNDDLGTIQIKVTATDMSLTSVSDIFALTVVNTNDSPTVANALIDQETDEDSTYTFTVDINTFNDVDLGDTLTYTATLDNNTQLPDWLSFDPSSRIFTGTPLNDQVGTIQIKVTATDQSLASISDSFALTVNNTNDAPTLENAIIDQSTDEDAVYTFTFDINTFNDVDTTDSLTYTATQSNDSALPLWLSFDVNTRTFSGTPLNDDVGVYQIKVTATDTSLTSATDIFAL
ncbi:Dystroglycan-type cadherin-like domain protein, partial [Candidatus Magnetomorum sp. HK-1]